MGVIDIRMRSERLGNIGSVAPVHVPDFMGVVAMRNRANDALFHGLADGLDRGLRGASAIWATIQDREDQRQVDRYVGKYRENLNAMNESVGQDGRPSGFMHEDFDNGLEWISRNRDERNKMGLRLGEELKLTERQKRLARRALQGYNEHVDTMWTGKVASKYKVEEDKGAGLVFAGLSDQISKGDNREKTLEEWQTAGNRLMKVRGLMTKESKDAFWRDAALKVMQDGERLEFEQMAAQADAAGVGGEKLWDDMIEKTDHREFCQVGEKDGEIVFKSPAAHLTDEQLANYHDEWTKRAKAAKAEWLKGMKASTDRAYESARTDITAIPAPDPGDAAAVRDYEKRVGQMYDGLLYETKADGTRQLTEFGARLKAYAPLKFASANACIGSHAKKYDAARVQTNGIMLLDMLDSGVDDEMYAGGRRTLTSAEKIRLTEFLMAHNEIGKADYHAALKRIGEQEEPLAVEFWNTVSKTWGGDFAKVTTWKSDLLEYAFRDTESARKFSSKDSDFRHRFTDETGDDRKEKMLYSQVMQAARIACQRMLGERKRGETDEQAIKRAVDDFNRMTGDTQEGIMKLNYKRRFEAENARLDNLRTQRRRTFTDGFPRQFDVRPATRMDISEKENN